MRKIILISTALLVSGAVFASDAPFSTGPAPTQIYHDASASNVSTPQTPAPVAAAQVAAPAVAASTPATSSDMSSGAAMINSAGVDTSLEDQVSMLSQTSLAYDQETDQHIQNLVASNQAMGVALQTTNQEVVQLQEAIAQLQAGHLQTPPAKTFLHSLNRQDLGVFIEFGGAAAFLLALGVLMGRLMTRRSAQTVMSGAQKNKVGDLLSDDSNSEYDFMSTAEAIPAKLDLARSYMMMGDYDQARMILRTVMEKGSKDHRGEAESILNKIRSAGN